MIYLNLGCGFKPKRGFVNVDKYDNCKPDVVHDLNVFPYPWDENSIDGIEMIHTLEHLDDWWGAFCECARILKPGGRLQINVPDDSSTAALAYRDHNHIFFVGSFHGIMESYGHSTNAWACKEADRVPVKMINYVRVPFKKYNWMLRFPRLLAFCAEHMGNFIHEGQYTFEKIGDRYE